MHTKKIITEGRYRLQYLSKELHEPEILDKISNDLRYIFSNSRVTEFAPEMKIVAEMPGEFMFEIITGYTSNEKFTYLLFDTHLDKTIGVIILLPSHTIQKSYPFLFTELIPEELKEDSWAIQYYLDPFYWGNNVMSSFVNKLIVELFKQYAKNVFAFTNPKNINSEILLKKSFFIKICEHEVEGNPDRCWNLWGVGICKKYYI
jgi:RimJ/RimL family protein N-acetyltransferase